MLFCADILASLDKLTDAFGGSSQGSYNGPAVFVSIFISQLPQKSFGCSVIIYLPFNSWGGEGYQTFRVPSPHLWVSGSPPPRSL